MIRLQSMRLFPFLAALLLFSVWAVPGRAADSEELARVEAVVGTVQISPAGARTWVTVTASQPLFAGDQVRTGERSRMTLRMRDGSIVHLDELTTTRLEGQPSGLILNVLRGILSFFHRNEPGSLEVRSGSTSALIRGTEFAFAASEDGTVQLTLLDGAVLLKNPLGSQELTGGEAAIASPTVAPHRTALLTEGPVEALQWQLYYPAILDPGELNLPSDIVAELAAVLQRYQEGDLLGALAAYPAGREPEDPREQILLAALVLSVGNVAEAERRLASLPRDPTLERFAVSLHQLINAARLLPCDGHDAPNAATPALATEWMARSYCRQSARDLDGALAAARKAAEHRPDFGFAWARIAALEFSFGHRRAAAEALDRALQLSPRNAAAVTLSGFLAAARFEFKKASERFDAARALDPRLADAWLGRGLVAMREGRTAAALEDMTIAASTEPQRGVLRSYLGRAYAMDHQLTQAGKELDLAEKLDAEDPTVWLYRGLLLQQESRINEAIRALNTAEDLTEERALYRSRLLLEQDRSVVNGNRAIAYRDGGLEPIARREAGRALSLDAANAGAHRFLADSYASTERVNLRYESARAAEYLQANLLAPVGAGPLSASLSQQDYSPLLEQDRPHVYSVTSYEQVGGWQQTGGIYGTTGRLGYAADAYYASGDGVASNTDFEQTAVQVQGKFQAGDRDTVYLQALGAWQEAGDLVTYGDPYFSNTDLRTTEELHPILAAGWHRAWSPEHHTLVLGGWIDSSQSLTDPTSQGLVITRNPAGQIRLIDSFPAPQPVGRSYDSSESWLSIEGQHIWETPRNTVIVGVKYQSGRLDAENDYSGLNRLLAPPGTSLNADARRTQIYAYDTWRIVDSLALTAGISGDWETYPGNFRSGPLTDGDEQASQASPKFGVVWEARTNLWLRGAYTRSLGGVGLEQSLRLEPTQVAGFNQAFRSLIPESVVGTVPGTQMQTGNAAIETRFGPNTLLGLEGDWLKSSGSRRIGAYGLVTDPRERFAPTSFAEDLEFVDRGITAYVGQLAGRDWTLFLRYRAGFTDYEESLPEAASNIRIRVPGLASESSTDIVTQAVTLSGRFNHPTGWFAGADTTWTHQSGSGAWAEPTDAYWMVNAFVGHRFWERRVEILVGLENLANQSYQVSPLTLIAAPPQERSFVARLKWTY
ncbi:MAG: FecR domain-containing protein [Verrucomicrobiales bacterium]|nr:FecR domain-containing protein [Verrucomicrobiales bacterium]